MTPLCTYTNWDKRQDKAPDGKCGLEQEEQEGGVGFNLRNWIVGGGRLKDSRWEASVAVTQLSVKQVSIVNKPTHFQKSRLFTTISSLP